MISSPNIFTDDTVARCKAVPISDILKHFGRTLNQKNFFRSPYTEDKTASAKLYVVKNSFYCFSANKGGDALELVKALNNNDDFVAAIEFMGKTFGIAVEREESEAAANKRESVKRLIEAYTREKKHYIDVANAEHSKSIEKFFAHRGILPEIYRQYEVGYCDDRSGQFYGRIMFPFGHGNMAGFTARLPNYESLDEEQKNGTPKYKNSAQSGIFNKKEMLYGVQQAERSIRETKTVYIVEGPTDCMAFVQLGVPNTVALCGTALTPEHLRLLDRLGVKSVVFCLDGDTAGYKATKSAVSLSLGFSMMTYIVGLTDDRDPCNYLQNKIALPAQQDAVLWLVNESLKHIDQADDLQREQQIANSTLALLSEIPDEALRKAYLLRLKEKHEKIFNIEALFGKAFGTSPGSASTGASPKQTQKTRGLLRVMKMSEYMEVDAPPSKYIGNGLFEYGGTTIIFAEPGLGKTIFAFYLSVCLSSGQAFAGLPGDTIEPLEVLYCDMEYIGAKSWQKRYKDENGNAYLFPDKLFIAEPLLERKCQSMTDLFGELERIILDNKIKVLVLDNMSALSQFGIDWKDDAKTADFFFALKAIQTRRLISIVLLAHSNKGQINGLSHMDYMKGNRYVSALGSTIWTIRRTGKDRNLIYIRHVKYRDDKEWEITEDNCLVFSLKKRGAFLGVDFVGRQKESHLLLQITEGEISERTARIVQLIDNDGYTIAGVARELKLSENTVRSAYQEVKLPLLLSDYLNGMSMIDLMNKYRYSSESKMMRNIEEKDPDAKSVREQRIIDNKLDYPRNWDT